MKDFVTNPMKSEQFKYRLIRGLLRGVAKLPLRILYLLSDAVAFVLHRLLHYRAEVIRGNLRMAFPDKSDAELRKIESEYYHHLCDIFVETAKLAHISDEEIERRVRIKGMEELNEELRQGKSVVLLLGHYGNWEWVTCAARKMLRGSVMCEIYHPLNDKVMDRLMLELRSRFGTENIPMRHTLRRLLEIHRNGEQFVCGFISDQRPFEEDPKHWTDFLGIDTPIITGGEAIGERLGAEFFYAEMSPEKRGHYTLTLSRLQPERDDGENPYSRAYFRRLEESIRRKPPYWLWSHNRWVQKRSYGI